MPWFQIAVLILQADIKQLLKQSAYFIQFNSESAGWNVVELQTVVLTRFWLTNRSHEFFHSCQVSVTQSASKIQTRTQKNPLWCAFEVPAQALRNAERVRKTPQGDPAKNRGSLVRNACNGPHFSMYYDAECDFNFHHLNIQGWLFKKPASSATSVQCSDISLSRGHKQS